MLIPAAEIVECLEKHETRISGVLHIGAHNCEERAFYNNFLKITDDQIIWIDALPFKVEEALEKGIPNVFHAVVSDKDDEIVEFKRAAQAGEQHDAPVGRVDAIGRGVVNRRGRGHGCRHVS